MEFALVGGLFFFLIFAVVNGGLFLFGRSTVEHAASVGVQTISTEGTCTGPIGICATPPAGCPSDSADVVGICRMDAAGLNSTALITVQDIQVWRVVQSNGAPLTTCNSVGQLPGTGSSTCLDYTCDSSGDGPGSGSLPCENTYTVGGGLKQDNWPVTTRHVSIDNDDFAELIIDFSYQIAGMPGGTSLHLTTTNVFRLEPQQL